MVKINGQKINMDALEDRLSSVLGTRAVCVASEDLGRVVAYYLDPTEEYDIERLISLCRDNMESSLIPSAFHALAEFPTNAHGKIDRSKLRLNTLKRHVTKDPVSFLIQLWTRALGSAPKEDDNFVTCGGDSFLAVTLTNALIDAFPETESTIMETLINENFAAVSRQLGFRRSYSKKSKVGDLNKASKCTKEPHEKLESSVVKRKRLKGRDSEAREIKVCNADVTHCEVDWKVDFEKCIDSSPLFLKEAEEILVVGSHSGLVKALKANDGSEVWSTRLADRVEGSPTSDFKSIYVGCYDGCLHCLSLKTGEIIWSFHTEGIVKSTPLIVGNTLYFGSYDKFLYKLTTTGGKLLWKTQISSGSIYTSPVSVPSGLFVSTLDGVCACIDHEGGTMWSINLVRPVFASPLFHESRGQLYVACVDHCLHAVSLEGQILWKVETEAPIFSSPILYNDRILFGCHDKHVYCLDPGGGLIWRTCVSSPVFASVDFDAEGRIVCVTIEGGVYVLDGAGNVLHKSELPGNLFSSPIFLNRSIITGCRDNFLYCLRVSSGR